MHYRRTDRPTDEPTDRRTDKASYRDAGTHLKRHFLFPHIGNCLLSVLPMFFYLNNGIKLFVGWPGNGSDLNLTGNASSQMKHIQRQERTILETGLEKIAKWLDRASRGNTNKTKNALPTYQRTDGRTHPLNAYYRDAWTHPKSKCWIEGWADGPTDIVTCRVA